MPEKGVSVLKKSILLMYRYSVFVLEYTPHTILGPAAYAIHTNQRIFRQRAPKRQSTNPLFFLCRQKIIDPKRLQ